MCAATARKRARHARVEEGGGLYALEAAAGGSEPLTSRLWEVAHVYYTREHYRGRRAATAASRATFAAATGPSCVSIL